MMAYMELGLYTEDFPHFLHDVGGEVGSAVRVDPCGGSLGSAGVCSVSIEQFWQAASPFPSEDL